MLLVRRAENRNGPEKSQRKRGIWKRRGAYPGETQFYFGAKPYLILQQRRYSADRLICPLINKPLGGQICLREANCLFYYGKY